MPTEQEVRIYARPDGSEPFAEWLRGLRDKAGRNRVRQRINRLRTGHFGDVRSVGDRVQELRIHTGPGYRVYFGREGDAVVILLCGGDKGTQTRDIERARDHWRDYRSRTHG